MAARECLLFMLESNQQVVRKLIDDVSEEESMVRGKDRQNHIRWHVGHMLYFNAYTLSLLGDDSGDFELFKKDFAGGTNLSEVSEDYPPLADLRARLFAVYDGLMKAVRGFSETDLDRQIIDCNQGGKKFPLWRLLSWAVMHDFYHCGQITHARRTLGRGRPFG